MRRLELRRQELRSQRAQPTRRRAGALYAFATLRMARTAEGYRVCICFTRTASMIGSRRTARARFVRQTSFHMLSKLERRRDSNSARLLRSVLHPLSPQGGLSWRECQECEGAQGCEGCEGCQRSKACQSYQGCERGQGCLANQGCKGGMGVRRGQGCQECQGGRSWRGVGLPVCRGCQACQRSQGCEGGQGLRDQGCQRRTMTNLATPWTQAPPQLRRRCSGLRLQSPGPSRPWKELRAQALKHLKEPKTLRGCPKAWSEMQLRARSAGRMPRDQHNVFSTMLLILRCQVC
mmetsp:Transcript_15903/g.24754  ORF Transcript_15903/g.24754 Transcript_15903/m.24754 type:complete len:292 (+) Transcript_15903:298-1173(+)